MATQYAHPETLVSCDWVDQHKQDNNVRLVEVDVDTTAYGKGHIEGAIGWNWQTQICDTVRRDITPKAAWEKLLGESGIANDTIVVLYGDNNNWFAAWAFWQFKIYGHADVRLMNGGRKKWADVEKRPVTTTATKPTTTNYKAKNPDFSIRSFLHDVEGARDNQAAHLVDVRSPQEFTGEVLAPPGLPETCQRGGHIPGAKSIPWSKAVNEDGTFKTVEDLKSLYEGQGIRPDKEVIAYCRIGERSSHTWFVLQYLLGYPKVKNYDGSWTEYGNLVAAPIEK